MCTTDHFQRQDHKNWLFRDVHASRAKTAFSHSFTSPWRSLRKRYPTVGVQHGHNVGLIGQAAISGVISLLHGGPFQHEAFTWHAALNSGCEKIRVCGSCWFCLLGGTVFFNKRIRCCPSLKTWQSMGEFISLWQVATLWSLAESKCYCRVITKERGKQCPEEINSTEQIMEQYKAVEYRQ